MTIDRTALLSCAAAIALTVGTQAAFSEDNTNDSFLDFVAALQNDSDATGPETAVEIAEVSNSRKLTIPSAGVYRFGAPAESGVKLFINNVLVIDVTGPKLREEPIKAVQSLTAGAHAVRIVTFGDTAPEVVEFSPIGASPLPLFDATEEISLEEAMALAASNGAVISSTPSSGTAPKAPSGGLLGLTSAEADTGAFTIGGSSSRSSRTSRVETSTGSDGSSAERPTGSTMPFRSAALAPATNSTTTSPTTTTTSSGGVSVPSFSGGGSGGVSTPGAGTPTPGTPTAAPAPTAPAPTPTPIDPTITPTAETVQASPLSPPVGVEITQAVQLTSAGNANGEVSSSGGTLFGAVMSSSVFDIVNVTMSGSGRTTTVDVGPTTGQFAVRLFPEDFDANNQVEVTLVGASTASSEVEALPVTYSLRAMPAEDGVTQALSRITFGATPGLYARVRAIGFGNYVEEQLNPDSINDAAFNAMTPNAIVDPTDENGNRMLDKIAHYDLAHAAFSEKQLQVVMGNFWSNHFHAVTKGTNMYVQNLDDRRFFRDNAFGTFRELLLYSARSPLMSQYLDNDENRFNAGRANEGINENYGREVLELSTVGVEAGYTPADVDMVSRVFSGWRYERTNPNAEGVAQTFAFQFFPNDHDPQDKFIPFLSTVIQGREGEAGVQEGEELIQILANQPSTQARTCRKIVQLLVSDSPPTSFVDACVAAWGVDGDIEAMLRAILLDPAYITNVNYQRNKAKTPFEYAVSVIRTFGARPENPVEDDFWNRFREAHQEAGHNSLRFPVPTGLPEVSAAWLNSASMVAAYSEMTTVAEQRQNFGIDLATDIADAGLETAEEVAAYLLAVGTADNFTLPEFEQLVGVLKGEDGIFEPLVQDETNALERAMGMLIVAPSFQLQ